MTSPQSSAAPISDEQIDSLLERHQGAMTKSAYKAAADEIRALIDQAKAAARTECCASAKLYIDGLIDLGNANFDRATAAEARVKELLAERDGWKLVPIRPTLEMAEAAAEAHYGKRLVKRSGGANGIAMPVSDIDHTFTKAFQRFWKGALSVSPPLPSAPSGLEDLRSLGEEADFTIDDALAAREILRYLGIGDEASLEPGDRRRNKIAAIIRARVDAAIEALANKERG